MKKLFAILVAVCLMACIATVVSAEHETINLLDPEKLTLASSTDAVWTWNDDGTLHAQNNGLGDNALMTEIFLEPEQHVVLDLVCTVNESTGFGDNPGAFGIMFGEYDAAAPFLSWVCHNVDVRNTHSRLFGTGISPEPRYDDGAIAPGQHHITCEITAENEFKLYYDNYLYGSIIDESWFGAYVGVMTWWCDATFESYTLTYVDDALPFSAVDADAAAAKEAEAAAKAAAEEAALAQAQANFDSYEFSEVVDLLQADNFKYISNPDAAFSWEDGKLVGKNLALGDTAYMTDYFLDPSKHVVVSMTGANESAGAIGIMFAFNNAEDPFGTGWGCLNLDANRPSSRIFMFGGTEPEKNYEFVGSQEHTIAADIYPDGTTFVFLDGELYGMTQRVDWKGAYMGAMTWFSDAFISAYTVSYVAEEAAAVEEAPAEEAPAEEAPVEEAPAEEAPAEEVVEVVEAPVVVAAPQTFDAVVIAAVAAVVSLAGYAVSKKSR